MTMKNAWLSLVTVFVLLIFAVLLAAPASAAPDGQGYKRPFNNGHIAGTVCDETFSDHPYIDGKEFKVIKQFTADASYYGNRLFHNRNDMKSGNKLHECDATVVAFNGLKQGDIVRITRLKKDKDTPANIDVSPVSIIVVVQDKTAKRVKRPDLSRGAFEDLKGDGLPAEGILEDLIYEVLEPVE